MCDSTIKSAIIAVTVITLVCLGACTTSTHLSKKELLTSEFNAEVVINLARFEHNIETLQRYIATENARRERQAEICVVMKGDAYGFGLKALTPIVSKKNIPCIGIASNSDAKIVRESGYKDRLMRVRAATGKEMREAAVKFDVEELVGTLEQAALIANIGEENKRTVSFHLALNSAGMGRNGLDVSTQEGRRDAGEIVNQPYTKVVGMMTHFPAEASLELLNKFKHEAKAIISENSLIHDEIILHAANTGATLALPETHLDMVRPGRAVYGLVPGHEEYLGVLTFKTTIASIHHINKESTVSYGSTETVGKGTTLANIPVGVSDGYPLGLSREGVVLIKGQRAKVIGRVTMNTIMVDITHIENVRAGDEVILFGEQGDEEISLPEMKEGKVYVTTWGRLNPIRYIHEAVDR